jgi:CRISPR/Cas system-associated exonuclease Cas4 (RecB family)
MTAESKVGDRESLRNELQGVLTRERFQDWYRRREYRRNVEDGKPHYNEASAIQEPELHIPSKLLQCHRKVLYQQENSPQENADPSGIFWFGTRFEEDIIFPFLRDELTTERTYVTNSIWLDYEARTDAGKIQIRGLTDPIIVDKESRPILPTEIKTKSSLEHVTAPSRHHEAQLHAYLYGLSEKFDVDVTEGVIIYGSRKSLDIEVFPVEFNREFWRDIVLDWAGKHTQYRLEHKLPPADPEYEWECGFCDYQERCGEGRLGYADIGTSELLPGYIHYPKAKVVEYLEFDSEACLTPSLAHEYPELASRFSIYPWECYECQLKFPWNSVDSPITGESQPVCPNCANDGVLAELSVASHCSKELLEQDGTSCEEGQE